MRKTAAGIWTKCDTNVIILAVSTCGKHISTGILHQQGTNSISRPQYCILSETEHRKYSAKQHRKILSETTHEILSETTQEIHSETTHEIDSETTHEILSETTQENTQ